MPTLYADFRDIFAYLDAGKNSLCIAEAQRIVRLKSFYEMCYTQWVRIGDRIFFLFPRTSALTESPRAIQERFLKREDGLKIGSFSCFCVAGRGGTCKHIAAALLFCQQ